MNSLSQYLNLPIHHLHLGSIVLDPLHGVVQHLLHVCRIVRYARQRDRRGLPAVVVINLGGGYIELSMQARQQRFQHRALALQRLVAVDVQFDEAGSNNHGVILA